MKVLLVGSDAGISGAGLSMIALSKQLNNMGVDTSLVVRKGNTQKILNAEGIPYYNVQAYAWVEELTEYGIKKYLCRMVKVLLNVPAFFYMLKIIDKEAVDIVHINASTTYIGALAALCKKKKLVWHYRELLEEDLGGKFWNKNLAYSLLRKSDCCIAISQCVLEKHKPYLGDTPFKVVYNGVDVDKYFNSNHTIFKNDKVIFTVAGRISANKGQLDVLMAMCDLLKSREDIELWIVGDGTEVEKKKLIDFVEENAISNSKIKFFGYVTDMPTIWGETDVAVIASKLEAFGRVTVEAMCSGCLVLGADTGGTIELVEDGKTGIIYRQGSKESLEERINEILNEKEMMSVIASEGRAYASKMFTSYKNAEQIKQIYEEILDDRCI